VDALVQLDRDDAEAGPDVPWRDWYAERLLASFG
jgi:hypothetical protein